MTRNIDRPHSRDSSPPAGDVDTADLVALLADEHRRRVLRCLHSRVGSVSLSTLADRLADGDDEDRSRTALRLHHVHLPKLAEYGLLSYDSTQNVVSATRRSAWTESRFDR